jgi:hypothetical protein
MTAFLQHYILRNVVVGVGGGNVGVGGGVGGGWVGGWVGVGVCARAHACVGVGVFCF